MKTATGLIDPDDHDLPRRLRALREQRHLTKADLAERSGLSSRTIHDLEMGRRDRIQEKTLMLLADALEVPVEELLARPEAEEKNGQPPRPLVSRRGGVIALGILVVLFGFAAWYAWSFARNNAEPEWVDRRLVVRDRIFHSTLWTLGATHEIERVEASPWRRDHLLVYVDSRSPDTDKLLCLERADGDTVWSVGLDVAAVERAFGPEDLRGAGFTARPAGILDVDGDGEIEMAVRFTHGRFYPCVLCLIDRDGRILGQYASKGHVLTTLVTDLDNDGCQELLCGGTNNGKAYQGAQVILLDADHWRGASVDSLCDPWSTEPDSAAIRLVIPAYPQPYMELIPAERLAATSLKVHRGATGNSLISISVKNALNSMCSMLVFLDAELHPEGCTPEDSFLEQWVTQWPDSLTNGTGPGDPAWRAQWLAKAVRFEAGHWPPAD